MHALSVGKWWTEEAAAEERASGTVGAKQKGKGGTTQDGTAGEGGRRRVAGAPSNGSADGGLDSEKRRVGGKKLGEAGAQQPALGGGRRGCATLGNREHLRSLRTPLRNRRGRAGSPWHAGGMCAKREEECGCCLSRSGGPSSGNSDGRVCWDSFLMSSRVYSGGNQETGGGKKS